MKSGLLIWLVFFLLIGIGASYAVSEIAAAMSAHADQINRIDALLNHGS